MKTFVFIAQEIEPLRQFSFAQMKHYDTPGVQSDTFDSTLHNSLQIVVPYSTYYQSLV